MATLRVNEIFHSIQGEGRRAGLPCVFVRLHGCGLRCAWCDTPYALDHRSGGEARDVDDILAAVARHRCRFVELTGGEPLEQEACIPLLTALCDQGYEVAIETGGHVDIAPVDPRVSVIMDVKCPGSGMEKRNHPGNIAYLKPGDEVKFVLADRVDYDWAVDFIRREKLHDHCKEILLSPVSGSLVPRDLAAWMLADGLQARLQLQLHKFIWDPDTRGV
jgi:7-carboxy-7-deazaguanine synthase